MNKRDIEGFKIVCEFLDKQDGVFFNKSYKARLMFLKYVGIGEGMEWEQGIGDDLQVLVNELGKVIKNDNNI